MHTGNLNVEFAHLAMGACLSWLVQIRKEWTFDQSYSPIKRAFSESSLHTVHENYFQMDRKRLQLVANRT